MVGEGLALCLGLSAAIVLCLWGQGAEAAPGAAPGLKNTVKWSWEDAKSGYPQNTEGRGKQREGQNKIHKNIPLIFSWSFTFLSPSWGAGGRLLGGSEGSEPGRPSPGTAFRGEGPPGRLGGPSAAPLSPPSGELRWLQGPDDT